MAEFKNHLCHLCNIKIIDDPKTPETVIPCYHCLPCNKKRLESLHTTGKDICGICNVIIPQT